MSLRHARLLVPLFVLFAGVMTITASGSGEPELPDTTADSMLAYLDEVDYRESWELWPGLGKKTRAATSWHAYDHLPQPCRL